MPRKRTGLTIDKFSSNNIAIFSVLIFPLLSFWKAHPVEPLNKPSKKGFLCSTPLHDPRAVVGPTPGNTLNPKGKGPIRSDLQVSVSQPGVFQPRRDHLLRWHCSVPTQSLRPQPPSRGQSELMDMVHQTFSSSVTPDDI